jgi:hypothetical protein
MASSETRQMRRLIPLALISLAAVVFSGCGKKKEEDPIAVGPPPGAASSDELSVGIGPARGLNERLAPTSTKWRRIIPLDEKSAVLIGDVAAESITLVTSDAGKTWRPLRTPRESWSNVSAALDGTVVVGAGARDGAVVTGTSTIEAARISFGSLDGGDLNAPSPLFPDLKGPAKGILLNDSTLPAVLSADLAAVVADESPRHTVVFFAGKPGAEAVAKIALPPAEKFIPAPFGRPPVLLSIKGRDVLTRPFPLPGKPLDKPAKIAGIVAGKTTWAELAAPTMCEAGAWSFQIIKQAPAKLLVLGVSAARTTVFALPEQTLPTTHLGCGADHVVVEGGDNLTKAPILIRCDLAGKCDAPQNGAFRLWPEPHEHEIWSATAEKGVIGVLTARAGERWGLYLGQSPDGGVWERARVIGEGTTDRGRIELGAMMSFGKRLVLLFSAGVTGTSRRGWFLIASDDGGANWGVP